MTTQPYTQEQILASFNKGFKSTRLKAMAQEIAGLANRQKELLQHIAYLESLIEANGGKDALDLSRYVAEAQRELESIKLEGQRAEADAQERASQITEAAMQSLKKERSALKKETSPKAILQAQAEAEKILAEAKADAFRVANATWIEAQADRKLSAVDVAASQLYLSLEWVGDFSKKQNRVKLWKRHESFLRETKPYLENAVALVGTPEENGARVADNFLARLVPRYHEDNGALDRKVSLEVDGRILGWVNTKESDYYSRFLQLMDNLGIEVWVECKVRVQSSEKLGNLSSKISFWWPLATDLNKRMPQIELRLQKLAKAYDL